MVDKESLRLRVSNDKVDIRNCLNESTKLKKNLKSPGLSNF